MARADPEMPRSWYSGATYNDFRKWRTNDASTFRRSRRYAGPLARSERAADTDGNPYQRVSVKRREDPESHLQPTNPSKLDCADPQKIQAVDRPLVPIHSGTGRKSQKCPHIIIHIGKGGMIPEDLAGWKSIHSRSI
jgi:hypothetical protein